MTMRLPRPRHGDPHETTAELRELAASILRDAQGRWAKRRQRSGWRG